MSVTQKDADQTLRYAFDDSTNSFRVAGTFTSTNSANGDTGALAPDQATQVGGVDPDGDLQALKVDEDGNLLVSFDAFSPIHTIIDSSALPTGASTSALQVSGNSQLVTIASNQTNGTQVTSINSSALPTGAATETTLAAINTKTPALGQALAASSTPVVLTAAQITTLTPLSTVTVTQTTGTNLHTVVDNFPATQPISGAVKILDSAGTNQLSVGTSGNILVSGASAVGAPPTLNPVSVSGVDGAGNKQNLTIITGTNALKVDGSAVTQPVSAASLPLPSGASTSALQSSTQGTVAPGTAATSSTLVGGQFNTSLPTLSNTQQSAVQLDSNGRQIVVGPGLPTSLGQATMANSQPVVIASDQSAIPVSFSGLADLYVVGQSAQTAVVNNILTVASGTAATDAAGYHSATVQVVSTGTAGTFIFEGSNDNTNFQTIPVFSQLILTGTPIVAAITATSSQLVYTFPVNVRYVRLRIATTITGGSIQAITRLSAASFTPAILQVAQATGANLNVSAAIASGTVTTVSTVTSANTAIPGIVADVASAALTTTTTTATLTPTFGSCYQVNIPVTVVSGSSPTLSVQVQESADTGTNWYTVYTFPTIIATGSYNSPVMTLTGNRVRYVQTVTGSTPSFTRAINRLQSSGGTLAPSGTIFTDRSGSTSATPSTSTQVAAANQIRRYLLIQNLSLATGIYINFTSAATAGTGSLYLAPLASYGLDASTMTTEAINVLSTGASIPFTCKEG